MPRICTGMMPSSLLQTILFCLLHYHDYVPELSIGHHRTSALRWPKVVTCSWWQRRNKKEGEEEKQANNPGVRM